jgi:hypothetical protein
MSVTDSHSAVEKILKSGLLPIAVCLVFFKLVSAAYSWVFLYPLKRRLYNESKKSNSVGRIIEYSFLILLLTIPLLIAQIRHSYFGLSSIDTSIENLETSQEKDSKIVDKEVKIMSISVVEKMRDSVLKGMEMLSLAETARLHPEAVNAMESVRMMKFAEDSKNKGQELDVAFKKLEDLVKKSDEDRHWIYLQAVDRYMKLCKKSINLRMLSIASQDWTSENGNEARKKLASNCDALRNLTWEENVETRRKMDAACKSLDELPSEDSVESRRKLGVACEAITEGCLAVVKSGFFIPKEYQIAN